MPEFSNPLPGLVPDRKITIRELTRSLRLMIAAEHEAVHLYEALADATDHELARAVLQDIANEERVHAGEFMRLLSIILPDEDGFLAEGAEEVNELAAQTPGVAQGPEAGAPGPAPAASLLTVGDMKNL